MRLSVLLLLSASPAWAACPNDSAVFSCDIGGKALQICHWKSALIYQYGPEDQPDLSIAQPLETAAFTPWPGIGSAIWESVAFQNQGHIYEVWTSVDRDPGGDQSLQGGVNVIKDTTLMAELRCEPGTPSQSLDVIFGLKESIGQCWDFDSQTWTTACN